MASPPPATASSPPPSAELVELVRDATAWATTRGLAYADKLGARSRERADKLADQLLVPAADWLAARAGWLGARPYVAKFAPGPKLRLAWVVAWVLLLAEFAFLLAVWITMDARETFGVALRAMAVAFFVEPVRPDAARAPAPASEASSVTPKRRLIKSCREEG